MIFDKLTKITQNNDNKNDTLIAKKLVEMYINKNFLSIKEFADTIHVSESLLTVFSKKLNLKGYRELISLLKFELAEQVDANFKFSHATNMDKEINIFDEIKKKVFEIFNKIKDGKVYILSSNQLKYYSNLIVEIFNLNNINTINIVNDYLFYNYIEKINQNDSILLFFAGQGNEILIKIYEKLKEVNKNIFIFCSNSQKYKLQTYKDIFILDLKSFPSSYIYRNISMSYILAFFNEALNLL
ncbi:MurR/RpiR family transcriptional regulator [Spiroplasma cantharicola]|uniref:HTH rpiR-type domain-containing protein n=1 Tax=Spiroplasma cantharicola TaxID=362837 RepID=A0A0M4JWY5_9MOLU|nr:hypothetical protein [Spiroplasma cantharicola]ALD66542.1 hypothetical protein SCANT_v1c06360 [Spiroplasma cantharicola]